MAFSFRGAGEAPERTLSWEPLTTLGYAACRVAATIRRHTVGGLSCDFFCH